MPKDRHDEFGAGRKVPIDGAHAHAHAGGNLAYGSVDSGANENNSGGVQQSLLVAARVGALDHTSLDGRACQANPFDSGASQFSPMLSEPCSVSLAHRLVNIAGLTGPGGSSRS